MKRCFAIVLSLLLLLSSVPMVAAEGIYNDDVLDWGELACSHADAIEIAEQPSTCSVAGHTGYLFCESCHLIVGGSKESLPLAPHVYDHDCDTECNACGAVREVGEHGYIYEMFKAPTCTEEGIGRYVCVNCGAFYESAIAPLGHHSVVLTGYAPTCTEDGLTDGETCANCYEVLVAQESIPATGHAYDDAYDAECNHCGFIRDALCKHNYVMEEIAPTCIAAGKKTYTCQNCGDSYIESIPALGHTAVTVNGYAPTCTEDGLSEGSKCSACGAVLTAQEIIPAIGHSYKLTEDVAPTCTAAGSKTYTCQNCGDSYIESIPTLGGHVYDDDYDADCNVCGEVREPAVRLGDVDDDGRINNRDLGVLQLYLNEWDVKINAAAADMDGNGRINNRDLGSLQRLLNDE